MRTVLAGLLDRGFDASYRLERDEYGRFTSAVRVRCSQCDALVINGIACHETGCPHGRRREEEEEEYQEEEY